MTRQDFILDENRDLICENGDFTSGNSDAQNVDLLLVSTKGSYKESPVIGVGLIHWLKTQNASLRSMRREIIVQLENDGYKASNFSVEDNGEFNLDYTNNY
ncbi:MAG: hypothetical protein IMY72_11725 [Bacteroidetes bacterium]|nr:hypothetical protein [Bacteroidota bacterium]